MDNPFQSEHKRDARTPSSGDAALARVITVTSGKGGVGKSNIALNLGIALGLRKHKVCVFDADANLANINILVGLTPIYTLEQLIQGERRMDEILVESGDGITIVPAASGVADIVELSLDQQQRLLAGLKWLESKFDYLIIDTAAGIDETVLRFIESAQVAIIVITPEPTSLTDAFALLKMLKKRAYALPPQILVNMADNQAESLEVYTRFSAAANKYLKMSLEYIGYIPRDKAIKAAVNCQRPVVVSQGLSPAVQCFHSLAKGISERVDNTAHVLGFSQFWQGMLAPSAAVGVVPKSPPAELSPAGDVSSVATSILDMTVSVASPAPESKPEPGPESVVTPVSTAEDHPDASADIHASEAAKVGTVTNKVTKVVELKMPPSPVIPKRSALVGGVDQLMADGALKSSEIRRLMTGLVQIYIRRYAQLPPVFSQQLNAMWHCEGRLKGYDNEKALLVKALIDQYEARCETPLYGVDVLLDRFVAQSATVSEAMTQLKTSMAREYPERFADWLEHIEVNTEAGGQWTQSIQLASRVEPL